MIIVAGYIHVAAKDRKAFLEGSVEAVRLARQEPDCLDFSVSADHLDDERVNVYERWESRSALMSCRGEGPTDVLNALIVGAEVGEFEVQPTNEGSDP
jgi:hypothetical protein